MIPLRYKIKRLWCRHDWVPYVKDSAPWLVCSKCSKIVEDKAGWA